MPELDLRPGKDYRWRRPLHPLIGWGGVLLGVGLLVSLFMGKDSGGTTSLFFAVAFVAFCMGLVVAELMRDID